jgi:DNA-binding MarR family transcriptional regulator
MESSLKPEIDFDLMRGLADFRRAMRAFLAASEMISRSGGVTAVQYQAMVAICAWEGSMAVRDLAQELRLTHSAAVQLIGRLVSSGVVRRSPGFDRRLVLVALTEAGHDLLASLAEAHLHALLLSEPQMTRSLRRLRKRHSQAAPSERQGAAGA